MSQPSKRPRTETITSSSHASTRLRVDSESESSFSLFAGAQLDELERSIFDGQLSDIDSDNRSDLISIHESPACSEVEDDEPANTSNSEPSGNWSGTRKAEDGYRLPQTNEDLSGPVTPDFGPKTIILNTDQKDVTRAFSRYLIQHWPSYTLNPDRAHDRLMVLADQTGFWHMLLESQFKSFLDYIKNDRNLQRHFTEGKRLFEELKEDIVDKTPFFSGLLLSIYHSCVGHLENVDNHPAIQDCIIESRALGKKLRAARLAGRKLSKEAIWIPVTRHDMNPVLHQHMVETKALRNLGERRGAIDGDSILIGVAQGWRVISAPPSTSTSSYSLILWEPTNAADHEPEFEKAIGACIHNAAQRSPMLLDPESDFIRLQSAAAVHNLRTKLPVVRHVKQAGLMTKDIGQQATSGAPYTLLPSVATSASANPTRKMIKKIQEQNQLRIDVKKYNPAIQSINFRLMQGFLPQFASQQYSTAVKKKMLNKLGCPDTSSFATYAYCAGLHLDNDESVTHGWVIKRGKLVHRCESNFVYGNHQVILQLNQGSHWFWRANIDMHGTTTNKVAMQHPRKWKTPEFLDNEDIAQWTRVNMIPKAVAGALLKSQE